MLEETLVVTEELLHLLFVRLSETHMAQRDMSSVVCPLEISQSHLEEEPCQKGRNSQTRGQEGVKKPQLKSWRLGSGPVHPQLSFRREGCTGALHRKVARPVWGWPCFPAHSVTLSKG